MSQSEEKSWDRPWSIDEMIANSNNWSLAGDAGLLKYLESVSEQVFENAKSTNDNLNKLMDTLDEQTLSLNIVANEFKGLHNSQFIESRVYEDDETMPVHKEPEKVEEPKLSDANRLEETKKLVQTCLGIVDKYYEKVEVPASDSEDETDGPSIIFKPIDPYINRPLPYLIGTQEWYKSDHVGLLESSSDSEHDNDNEQFSESEPERETHDIIPDSTDSDQDQDLSKTSILNPVASSTFNSQRSKDILDSSDDEDTNSLPPQVNSVNNTFISELTSKLGKVENTPNSEVNTRPIKKPKSNISGGMFSDEPPPLEDEDDIFIGKNMNSQLFPEKGGLFDEVDEENDFWNTKKSLETKKSEIQSQSTEKINAQSDNKSDSLFSEITKQAPKTIDLEVGITNGLFDDEDDGLFTNSLIKQPKKPIFQTYNTAPPLINEMPPDLESNEEKKSTKKPKILPVTKNILSQQISKVARNRVASSSSENEQDIPTETNKSNQNTQNINKNNLFDDNSSLFSDDLFSSTKNKKTASGLFDDKPTPVENSKVISKKSKIESLFDDDYNEEYDDLFSIKPKQKSKEKTSGLFSDTEDDLFSTISGNKSTTQNITEAKSQSTNYLDDSKQKSSLKTQSVDASNIFNNVTVTIGDSGVVKDQSTRIDSEDSSFFPGASSSRRHSTDIFHDDQKNDSMFITKTKSNVESTNHVKSDLGIISEISDSGKETTKNYTKQDTSNIPSDKNSKTNIFESFGDIFKSVKPESSKSASIFDNSDSEDDLFATNTSKKVVKSKESQKTKSVFADELFSDENVDLFDNKSLFDSVVNKDVKSQNIEEGTSKNKEVFDKKEVETIGEKEGPLPQKLKHNLNINVAALLPGASLPKKNTEKLVSPHDNNETQSASTTDKKSNIKTEGTAEKDVIFKEVKKSDNISVTTDNTIKKDVIDGQVLSSVTSPRKIIHNLNINVSALLPGSAPPKRHFEKSLSLDSEQNNENPVKTKIERPKSEIIIDGKDGSIGFDTPVNTAGVLSSAVKERAKITTKRKPSTRRGRQEAIRKSGIDFVIDDPIFGITNKNDNAISTQENQINSENIINNNLNNPNATKENLNIKFNESGKLKETSTNLFSPSTDEEDQFSIPRDLSDTSEENSLFGKVQIVDKIENVEVVSKNEDIGDNLLVKSEKKNTDSKFDDELFTKLKTQKNESLFSSDDSEPDLFSLAKPESKEDTKVITKSSVDVFEKKITQKKNDTIKSQTKKDTKSTTIRPEDVIFSDNDIESKKDDIFGGRLTQENSDLITSKTKKVAKITAESEDIFSATNIQPKKDTKVTNKEFGENKSSATKLETTKDVNVKTTLKSDDIFSDSLFSDDFPKMKTKKDDKTTKKLQNQDDLFGDDIFGEPSKDNSGSIFDELGKYQTKKDVKGTTKTHDDIFGNDIFSEKTKGTNKSTSIFDDLAKSQTKKVDKSEDDLFSIIKTDSKKDVKATTMLKSQDDIFGETKKVAKMTSGKSDDDIFNTEKSRDDKKSISIFDDDDDIDENFTFTTKKATVKPPVKANQSLFDDDDDDLDDELFGSASGSFKPRAINVSSNVVKKPVTQMKKVQIKSTDDIEDPLDVLKNK